MPERARRRHDGTGDCVGKGQWANDPDGIAEPLVNALRRGPAAATWDRIADGPDHEPDRRRDRVRAGDRHGDRDGRQRRHQGRLLRQRRAGRRPTRNGVDGWSFDLGHERARRGTYTLTATATDTAGQTATDQRHRPGRTNLQGTWVGTYGDDGYILGDWNGNEHRPGEPAGRGDVQPRAGRRATAGRLADDRRPGPPEPGPGPSAGRRPGTTRPRSGSGSTSPTRTAARSTSMPSTGTPTVGAENVTVDDGSGPRIASASSSSFAAAPGSTSRSRVGAGGSVVDHRRPDRRHTTPSSPACSSGGAGHAAPAASTASADVDIPGVQGNWVGTYGVDGYILGAWNGRARDLVEPAGRRDLHASSRGALQLDDLAADDRRPGPPEPGPGPSGGRRPGTTPTEMRVRLNFANAYSGTLHLYAVDWDAYRSRREHHRRRRERPADRRPRRARSSRAPGSTSRSRVGAGGSVADHRRPDRRQQRRPGRRCSSGGAGTRRHRRHRLPAARHQPGRPGQLGRHVRRRRLHPRRLERHEHATWSSLPAGVTYSLEQGSRYSWTTSPRRPTCGPSRARTETERRAPTWYDATQIRVRLNFANAYSGTLHLYAVDWDAYGRARERHGRRRERPADRRPSSSFIAGRLDPLPDHASAPVARS